MTKAGCQPVGSIDELSLMGVAEIVSELPRLYAFRKRLLNHFDQHKPDIFVGIDSPDFNLGMAKRCKQRGIATVHYVSPTVWAWRAGRIKAIRKAVDRMLCLFPFETDYYAQHGIDARLVGHPLAEQLQWQPDKQRARKKLGVADPQAPVLGILPGSRGSEVRKLILPFMQAARTMQQRMPELQIVIPVADSRLRADIAQACSGMKVLITEGQSNDVMAAADVLLLASGTAALEAMLIGRPMIVGYATSPTTAAVVRGLGLLKTRHFSLPNHLCEGAPVPECIQENCTPEVIQPWLHLLLNNPAYRVAQVTAFAKARKPLELDADQKSAAAVLEMVGTS